MQRGRIANNRMPRATFVNKADIPIIIQATTRSNLFEAKVLAPLTVEDTVQSYLVKRLKKFWAGPILLATSNSAMDDRLVEEGEKLGIKIFRGPQENLILRLWEAARKTGCQQFVRVYGSYPLTDLKSMERLVEEHLALEMEYSYNEHPQGVPWGMGCEVINIKTLERIVDLNLSAEQKEAGTLYIRQNPDVFKIHRSISSLTRLNLKLALETEKDLFLLRDIVRHLPEVDLFSVIGYLDDHPILATSNQEFPPNEVGLEKLYLHPDKIKPLIHQRDQAIDLTYPISVELSLTNRCNLNCSYCSDRGLRKRQGLQRDLSDDSLFRLFEDLKTGGTQGVVIEGGGEPTLHTDFEKIIRKLQEIGLPMGLITNGVLPLSSDILTAFEWIRVSLDSSTAEEFYSLKGRDEFEKVLLNIYNYAARCPAVGVGYVVTNGNTSEIETLILRLRQYGVSYIQLRAVIDNPKLAPRTMDMGYLKRYQTQSFSVIVDGLQDNAGGSNACLPCKAHNLTTVIGADGSVYLCGRLNIYDWLSPIGNIDQQSFKEIWMGPERRRQALQVLDAEFCTAHCPPCRLTKYNKLLKRLEQTKSPHFI